MSGREGVILLLFDLPENTREERKDYIKFRKAIRKLGYYCFQKSVYVKMLGNISAASSESEKLKRIAPRKGEVAALPMGFSAFSRMNTLTGLGFDLSLFSSEIISV